MMRQQLSEESPAESNKSHKSHTTRTFSDKITHSAHSCTAPKSKRGPPNHLTAPSRSRHQRFDRALPPSRKSQRSSYSCPLPLAFHASDFVLDIHTVAMSLVHPVSLAKVMIAS